MMWFNGCAMCGFDRWSSLICIYLIRNERFDEKLRSWFDMGGFVSGERQNIEQLRADPNSTLNTCYNKYGAKS